MSSKYVRGVKRNQIIQRWLQGIEDPEYEVFPTKKDGKYIVKLRESPLDGVKVVKQNNGVSESNRNSESDMMKDNSIMYNENDTQESEVDSTQDNDIQVPRMHHSVKQLPKRSAISRVSRVNTDSTINLEILEQLRNLGEEIRNDRFKKEQKQFIKQIVNKELNKSRIRSKYVPDLIPQDNETVEAPPKKEESIQETVYQEPVRKEEPDYVNVQPEPPKFKSRIRR